MSGWRRALVSTFVTYVAAYLLAAFVVMDLNAAHWPQQARAGVVFFGTFASIAAGCLAVSFTAFVDGCGR